MVERRLVRTTDKKDIGTLRVTRTIRQVLYDIDGKRLVVPQKVDSIIITISNPAGEQVVWEPIAIADLDQSGEVCT